MKIRTLSALGLLALLLVAILTAVFGASLWDVGANRAVQALGGWLKLPMEVFTFLGDEQFYLIAIPLVYWCLHKGLGVDLGILLVLSSFANTGLKSFFKHSRPFWEAPALKLGEAGSFSTPSGHAQTSAALFGQVATFGAGRRNRWLWIFGMALLIAMVCLSRVYLGVHFPGDVLWGAAVGLTLLALYQGLRPRLLPWLKGLSLGVHALLALVAAAAMLAVVAVMLAIPFGTGQTFGELYAEAWGDALADGTTVAGLAFGLWLGLVLEARYVQFSAAGPLGQRALRYVIGVAGLFAIWMGLRMLFPQEPLVLGLALRMVRYGLAMLWAIVIWPWLFVRIGWGTRLVGPIQEGA
ncbi:MAG: phosphatase PAP2 family protein [Anaerolineae bacterium]